MLVAGASSAAAPSATYSGSRCSGEGWARAAYHLGNRHVAVQVLPGGLRFGRDHVLGEMVRGLGLPVAEIEAPFEPEAGAYGAHGGHGHSADGEGESAKTRPRIHDHFGK